MRPNRLRECFADGGVAVCAWLSSDSGYLAEVMSHAGYDAVTVDLQHGMFGLSDAIRLMQAVSAGPAVPMVRCPSHDAAIIGKLLDGGAYGIVCPGVDTALEAAAFVSACRYPPAGLRSYGPSRGVLYGGADYLAHADTTVMAWAMVESAAALTNLEEILEVPGLDGVYVGPNDLALSLGERPAQTSIPPLTADALRHVVGRTRRAELVAGVFCHDLAMARDMVDLGYQLITPGTDAALLREAAAERIAAVRAAAGGPSRSK